MRNAKRSPYEPRRAATAQQAKVNLVFNSLLQHFGADRGAAQLATACAETCAAVVSCLRAGLSSKPSIICQTAELIPI